MKTLILGLGNPILTDDGVGVLVAEAVQAALPPEAPVEICELSVGGLTLMERMVGYDRVILVDAFEDGEDPGSFERLTLEDLRSLSYHPTQHCVSSHDTSLVTAYDMGLRLGMPLPQEVVIYAVKVQNVLDFSQDPTPAVAAAIPLVVQEVLKDLGFADRG